MAKATQSSWADVAARNRKIDAQVPKHGQEHLRRGDRQEATIATARKARESGFSALKPANPSANPLPGLQNPPKAAIPAFLKKQG
jgi:hypothetical protein